MKAESASRNFYKFKHYNYLLDALRARGYQAKPKKHINFHTFDKIIEDSLSVSLYFSTSGDSLGNVSIVFLSRSFPSIFAKLGLGSCSDRNGKLWPEMGLMAVTLGWLAINEDPINLDIEYLNYRLDEEEEQKRLIADLDSVGARLMDHCSTKTRMADFLLQLDSYPRRTRFGGGPRSASPYVYSAVLYLENGLFNKASTALDQGHDKYFIPLPRSHFEEYRWTDFDGMQKRIREAMEAGEFVCKD